MDAVFAFSPACYLSFGVAWRRYCVGQNNPPDAEGGGEREFQTEF